MKYLKDNVTNDYKHIKILTKKYADPKLAEGEDSPDLKKVAKAIKNKVYHR